MIPSFRFNTEKRTGSLLPQYLPVGKGHRKPALIPGVVGPEVSPDTCFRLKSKNLTFLIVQVSLALASGPNTEPHEFNYCNNTNVLSNRHMVGLLPSWALQSLLL